MWKSNPPGESVKKPGTVTMTGPKALINKFPGKCKKCGGWMPAGTEILWKKGEGAWHAACPSVKAEPPKYVDAPVAAKVAEVSKALSEVKAKLEVTNNLYEIAKGEMEASPEMAEVKMLEEIAKSTAEAHGACFSCNGAGYVAWFDTDYPCGPGHKSPSWVKENEPEVKAAYADVEEAKKSLAGYEAKVSELKSKCYEASAEKENLEHALGKLLTPRKFSVVKVVKGKKVAKGTVGKVMWYGVDSWGTNKVGLKVEGAEKLVYLPNSYVEVISHSEVEVN